MLLETRRYDLVHFDALGMVQYLDECRNIPAAISTTDAVSVALRRNSEYGTYFRRIYSFISSVSTRAVEKQKLASAAVVHVVSHPDAEALRSICPKARVEVISQPVPTEVMDWTGVPRPWPGCSNLPVVLFTGRLGVGAIREGFLRFLRFAWPKILDHHPQAKLVVVGNIVDYSVQRSIDATRNVALAGWVEDFVGLMASADVVVLPDLVGTGIKTRFLFGLALGRAIVASPAAAEGIGIVPEDHYLVANNPNEFAAGVVRILGNASIRRRLGENARQFAELNLTEEAKGDEWFQLYTSVSERSPV
jgi:glycosyltransferase involved in cell wall biosynthesis